MQRAQDQDDMYNEKQKRSRQAMRVRPKKESRVQSVIVGVSSG
jgi:hypothetical protein